MDNKTNPPAITHDRSYTKAERLQISLNHYYQELQDHTKNPDRSSKPVILQLAGMYDVSETTLRWHINNPSQKTYELVNQEHQLFTLDEEKVLVQRLIFLDDLNIPAHES